MNTQKPEHEGVFAARGLFERAEPALEIVGPLAIGVAVAGYGVLGTSATAGGALVAGWSLWLLSMVVVVLWKVATTTDGSAVRR